MMGSNNKIKVLMITGGDDKYHKFNEMNAVFNDFLTKAGFDAVISEDLDMLLPDNINKFDVVLNNSTNSYLAPEHESGLLNAIINGKPKGFIGIHGATITFRNSEKYLRMVGAKLLTHPEIGEEFRFKIDKKDHPITQGVNDFELAAELYLMEEYPPFEVLISTDYMGFKRPVTWIKPYGFGKVFYHSIGHDIKEIDNDNFKKIITNAIHWAVS